MVWLAAKAMKKYKYVASTLVLSVSMCEKAFGNILHFSYKQNNISVKIRDPKT